MIKMKTQICVFAIVQGICAAVAFKHFPVKDIKTADNNFAKLDFFDNFEDIVEKVEVHTFGAFVNSVPKSLVFYGTPWCKKCKTLLKTYIKVQEGLFLVGNEDVKLGIMNCDTWRNRWTCIEQGALQRYPIIYMYDEGVDVGVDVTAQFVDVATAFSFLTQKRGIQKSGKEEAEIVSSGWAEEETEVVSSGEAAEQAETYSSGWAEEKLF
ncbi:uncharacterized protein [Ptychodera flava]|uniref:uncharacterized protein n=1 Tax=Ptychodera flava TaxID=63121 RepID=UPI00396A2382